MGFSKNVSSSGRAINAILVIGFLGIVWLMIYGNLSGNLGFPQTTDSYTNETITLSDVGAVPSSAQGQRNPSMTDVFVTNASNGLVIASGNYTISGVSFTTATTEYNNSAVNVTYTLTRDSSTSNQAEGVIDNLSQGVGTFFSFSNTWFTILAIVLLIVILVGLLVIVQKIGSMGGGKSNSSNSEPNLSY